MEQTVLESFGRLKLMEFRPFSDLLITISTTKYGLNNKYETINRNINFIKNELRANRMVSVLILV